MSSMWRRTMLYLGLGPDEDYEDYPDDRVAPPAAALAPAPQQRAGGQRQQGRPPQRDAGENPSVRTLPNQGGGVQPKPAPAVRPVAAAPNTKPHVVAPTSFNHAQEVADKFKASQPVIMNLQGVDKELSRRLIDFASGLCYGIGGQMERVAGQVYLMTPSNVEISAEDRRRLEVVERHQHIFIGNPG